MKVHWNSRDWYFGHCLSSQAKQNSLKCPPYEVLLSPFHLKMESKCKPWSFQPETMYNIQNISHGNCFILLQHLFLLLTLAVLIWHYNWMSHQKSLLLVIFITTALQSNHLIHLTVSKQQSDLNVDSGMHINRYWLWSRSNQTRQ